MEELFCLGCRGISLVRPCLNNIYYNVHLPVVVHRNLCIDCHLTTQIQNNLYSWPKIERIELKIAESGELTNELLL